MALLVDTLIANAATDSYEDYTGSPLTFTPGKNALKSITLMPTVNRVKEEILYNASSGAAFYAFIDGGLQPGNDIQIKYIITDPKNSTDQNMYYLAKGMWEGGTLPGGFSTWVTTNQLPGKGNPMIKWKPILRDTGGTSHTYTYAVCAGAMPMYEQDGEHFVLTVTWKIFAAPSVV